MDIQEQVAAYAAKHGLDPALVTADAKHESGDETNQTGNPLAVGDAGLAIGVMQVHRIAAEDVGLAAEWDQLQDAVNAGDAETALALGLDIGCAYLAKMLAEFGGDKNLALAAYNQGPTVIKKAQDGAAYAATVLSLIEP